MAQHVALSTHAAFAPVHPWPSAGGPCKTKHPLHPEAFNLTLSNKQTSCTYLLEDGVWARGYAAFDVFFSSERLCKKYGGSCVDVTYLESHLRGWWAHFGDDDDVNRTLPATAAVASSATFNMTIYGNNYTCALEYEDEDTAESTRRPYFYCPSFDPDFSGDFYSGLTGHAACEKQHPDRCLPESMPPELGPPLGTGWWVFTE